MEPVIMELERKETVVVVGHQAVLRFLEIILFNCQPLGRCLLGYLLEIDEEQMPWLEVSNRLHPGAIQNLTGTSAHCYETDPGGLRLQKRGDLFGTLLWLFRKGSRSPGSVWTYKLDLFHCI